ncbi:MAG TPA: dTDP-4-dehydrorhamnose reductase [Xanthobacteraceae bacterium]|nr:dTDP-4-dehydrorhamnose reductase [Xanthobacteraceae bacterium]
MRILLTGASGQVGGALRRPLSRLGTVVAPGRGELDLAQPDTVAAALDRLMPDLIINPAAFTAVDRAEDERELAQRVNAISPGRIAAWTAAHAVALVHFSTDYVFDGTGERPWREDDATGPLSVYGASKLAGETAIRAAGGAHLIVRTSWVYAASGNNFLRTIARLAGERRELRIVGDQIGAPTSARAIARAVATIVGEHVETLPGMFARSAGVVHLACAGETSWHGFATAIVDGLTARGGELAATTIVPIRTDEYPTRARRPANSRLDQSRLRQVFGITLPNWSEALAIELDELAAP